MDIIGILIGFLLGCFLTWFVIDLRKKSKEKEFETAITNAYIEAYRKAELLHELTPEEEAELPYIEIYKSKRGWRFSIFRYNGVMIAESVSTFESKNDMMHDAYLIANTDHILDIRER